MDLTPHVAALRDDLAALSGVGSPEATARMLEPAVRLALMNALSDLAGEVSEQLDDRTVSLRLSGREVKVVVDRDQATGEGGFYAGPTSSPFAGTPGGSSGHTGGPGGPGFGGREFRGGPDVGDISRMTLRLVDQIKGQAEKAAAAQGMSLNSWVAQAVQGALNQHGRYGGRGGWGGWEGRFGRDDWDDHWPGGAGGDVSEPPTTSDGERSGRTTDDKTDGTSTGGRPDGPDGGMDGWVRG